jgi:hypothetical protein
VSHLGHRRFACTVEKGGGEWAAVLIVDNVLEQDAAELRTTASQHGAGS